MDMLRRFSRVHRSLPFLLKQHVCMWNFRTPISGCDLTVANLVGYRLNTDGAGEQTTSLSVSSRAFRSANEGSVHASHIAILGRNVMCCDTKYRVQGEGLSRTACECLPEATG